MAAIVEFRDVSKKFGNNVLLDNMNMTIEEGSFTVVFGAPASGKSTILRLLTGLEKPDVGQIFLRGTDVTKTDPGERNIGYVPQSFALYPHFKVWDNIAYPLKLMGMPKPDIMPIVQQAAELLKIGHLVQKKPDQLSGGEKQRVAIARGIVKNTNIFLLDDPLTGLDFKLREQLFDDLRRLKDNLGASFIYTTSDALEALMLAEQIRVFDHGMIVEQGDLEDVFDSPNHLSTMEALGFPETNILEGTVAVNGSQAVCQVGMFEFPVNLLNGSSGGDVQVAVRPQNIRVNPSENGLLVHDAEITLVEDLGSELVVYLDVGGTSIASVVRQQDAVGLTEGAAKIGIDPSTFVVFQNEQRVGEGVK